MSPLLLDGANYTRVSIWQNRGDAGLFHKFELLVGRPSEGPIED